MTPTPDQLRDAREAAGLTQADAATRLRVTVRAYQAWERGQNPMPASMWLLWRLLAREITVREALRVE